MITLRATSWSPTIVVVAQKPPPKLELNKTPPAEQIIVQKWPLHACGVCGVCGLIVFISCIVSY